MVWTSANGPKCPVSPEDRGEFMEPDMDKARAAYREASNNVDIAEHNLAVARAQFYRANSALRALSHSRPDREAEIERCLDCGQELPIRYPCYEQGCTIKCRF